MAITWTQQMRRLLYRGCPRTELSATLRRQRGWTQLQCSPWPTPDWTSFHVSTGSICLHHSTVEWFLEWHSRAEREKGRGRGGRGEEGYGGRGEARRKKTCVKNKCTCKYKHTVNMSTERTAIVANWPTGGNSFGQGSKWTLTPLVCNNPRMSSGALKSCINTTSRFSPFFLLQWAKHITR